MAMADKPISSYEAIAMRLAHAENKFISYCTERAGLTEAEARSNLDIMLRHKLIKLCPATGQYYVKNGAYLDADWLQSVARPRTPR